MTSIALPPARSADTRYVAASTQGHDVANQLQRPRLASYVRMMSSVSSLGDWPGIHSHDVHARAGAVASLRLHKADRLSAAALVG